MVDLDDFKRLNVAYGHAAGDDALRAFSHTLRRAVRRTDIIARFGGEEFVIVLPETSGPDAATKIEQIRREVEAMPLDRDANCGGADHLECGGGVIEPGE